MERIIDAEEKVLKVGDRVRCLEELSGIGDIGTITHISEFEVDGPMYYDDPPMQTFPKITVTFDDGVEIFTTFIWEADYYRDNVTYMCEEIQLKG